MFYSHKTIILDYQTKLTSLFLFPMDFRTSPLRTNRFVSCKLPSCHVVVVLELRGAPELFQGSLFACMSQVVGDSNGSS